MPKFKKNTSSAMYKKGPFKMNGSPHTTGIIEGTAANQRLQEQELIVNNPNAPIVNPNAPIVDPTIDPNVPMGSEGIVQPTPEEVKLGRRGI